MRIIYKERTYDYVSENEMIKHNLKMIERGWTQTRRNEIEGDAKYKWSATYRTGLFWNGVNGK